MNMPSLTLSWRPIAIASAVLIVLVLVLAYFVVPDLDSERTNDAYVEAHLTTITAKIPAYVQNLHIDDNVKIKAGDVLVELDPRDYVVQVDVARASLAAAEGKRKEADNRVAIADANAAQMQAEFQVSRANTELAAINLQRLNSVSDQRAVSSVRVDTAKAAADSTQASQAAAQTKVMSAKAAANLARTEITTADAAVAQAKAALAQAQLNLSYTKITALEPGTVANKEVEAGNYVQPGQALFSVVPATLYVIANFKETQLEHIKAGQVAIVRVDAYPNLRLKAHVDSLQRGTGSVFALLPPENATGNFVKVVQRVPVKIVFDDPREAALSISPGLSVEVRVQLAKQVAR